ncbi:MAG: DUF4286 family protein [Odoribacteraceae bacterium]|jgi:hypothetical protein|nr:DUF4286 family protein [Odoribacteraceae bacterium]
MRVVHNTTFHVDEAIEGEWIEALAREYIPAARESCIQTLFTRVRVAGEAGPAFSLQLFFDGEEACRRFAEEKLPGQLDLLARRFPGGFQYFCSTLEEVSHEP